MAESFGIVAATILGVSPETLSLMRKQDCAFEDFSQAFPKALRELAKGDRCVQWNRGNWTFRVHQNKFSAACRIKLAVNHEIQIDRILADAGLSILSNVEGSMLWAAELAQEAN